MLTRIGDSIADAEHRSGYTLRQLLVTLADISKINWDEASFRECMDNLARAALEAIKSPSNSDHDYFSAATERLTARELLDADVMFAIVADCALSLLTEHTEGEG